MAQAERLGDCLALAGLTGVATLVSLELVRSDGAADGAWGQVAATLQEGLSAARLLRLATAAMARGVVA